MNMKVRNIFSGGISGFQCITEVLHLPKKLFGPVGQLLVAFLTVWSHFKLQTSRDDHLMLVMLVRAISSHMTETQQKKSKRRLSGCLQPVSRAGTCPGNQSPVNCKLCKNVSGWASRKDFE